MLVDIGRRELIAVLGSAAAWPLAARGQQPAMPVVGLVGGGGGDISTRYVTAFRKGLNETGTIEGQNATVEYHWLEGQYERLPSLMADLVRRRVAVIATPGSNPAALAAKAATTTIPIVFGVGEDPVKLGLVASLARPGGNATGINIFNVEVATKRLGLLHELMPFWPVLPSAARPGLCGHLATRGARAGLKTAKALGIEIPISMQLLADEMIES